MWQKGSNYVLKSPVKPFISKRLFHRPYKFQSLPADVKLELQEPCQCFVNQLNSKLPESIHLDLSLELPTKVPDYHKHVLLLSKDAKHWQTWPSNLDLATEYPHNSMAPLKRFLRNTKMGDGILVNEVVLPGQKSTDEQLKFLVVPNMEIYEMGPEQLADFALFLGGGEVAKPKKASFGDYLKGADNSEAVRDARVKDNAESKQVSAKAVPEFQGEPYYHDLVLICGHYLRDARCGEIAPILEDKLNALKPDFKNGIVSHIGGHKFAGNIIHYKFNGFNHEKKVCNVDGIWLSQVLPQNLELIFENLDQNIILQDFYRGHVSNHT